jgi:tight adherence protein B
LESLINYLTDSAGMGYFFVLSSVFAGVVFFLGGLYFSFIRPRHRKQLINQRLWGNTQHTRIQSQLLKTQKDSEKSPLLRIAKQLVGWSKVENLQRTLYQADLFCPSEVFLSLAGILACAGYLAGALLPAFYWRLVLAAVLGSLPCFYLWFKKSRKTSRLERQMPEGMELLARSLRAGHTMPSAMELLGSEMGPPLGVEMRLAYEEQRLGLGLGNALRRLADRVDSQDLRFFVTAVLIQSETGGNLAEILENIGTLIRARLNLKGKISGLTAEGRFSALILALMPVGIFFTLYVLNREYVVLLLTDPQGHRLLMGGIVSMLFGILWMKKMIRIKV